VQALFEEVVRHHAAYLKEKTGLRKLCLAGGTALNSKSNGRLIQSGEFDQIFIPSGASDLGTCIGGAQYHWHQVMEKPRCFNLISDAWGPEYDDAFIRAEVEKYDVPFKELKNPARSAAEFIADGKIVGWFMEKSSAGSREEWNSAPDPWDNAQSWPIPDIRKSRTGSTGP